MELLNTQSSAVSRHFLHLKCIYYPEHPVLIHYQLCSYPSVVDSYPFKTTGKIISLYFYLSFRKDKRGQENLNTVAAGTHRN